jgi:hypothetical protein
MKPSTPAERFAILGGARDACATATDLQEIVAELLRHFELRRGQSSRVRLESAGLRGSSTAPVVRRQPG